MIDDLHRIFPYFSADTARQQYDLEIEGKAIDRGKRKDSLCRLSAKGLDPALRIAQTKSPVDREESQVSL